MSLMDSKYVIINESYPIVFSPAQNHSDFKIMGNITSAGFCSLGEDGRIIPYGKSMSLGISSDPTDEILLSMLFRKEY